MLSVDSQFFNKCKKYLSIFSLILVLETLWGLSNNVYPQNLTVAESLRIESSEKEELRDILSTTATPTIPQNDYYQEPGNLSSKDSGSEYLTLWVKLILIMGIFCIGAFFFLRFLKKKGNKQSEIDRELFQNLAEFSLGFNKKVQIIKVLNDYYILACGQEEISLLSKLEDKESIDILNLKSSQQQNQVFFEDSLKKYLNVQGWSPISITQSLKNKIKRI